MKPKRRWLQFSLRGMLVVVALCALWLSWHIHGVNAQKRLIERVEELGGTIEYSYQYHLDAKGGYIRESNPTLDVPDWLLRYLDADHFRSVISVSVLATPATDDDLRLVGAVPSVEMVDVSQTKVTGAGLRHLSTLPHLRFVSARGMHLTEEGLKNLAVHDELWILRLEDSDVTDSRLANLAGLKKLTLLSLSGTRVSEEGVKTLQAKLPNCGIFHSL